MPFKGIDHTADIGIRVWASDMASLFAEAARGMFEQITDLKRVQTTRTFTRAVDGRDETDLLINMLRELLYTFTGKGLLVKNVEFEAISETGLTMRISGEKYNPEKHEIRTEIKAVTYAGGDIRKTSEGFETVIIFDI